VIPPSLELFSKVRSEFNGDAELWQKGLTAEFARLLEDAPLENKARVSAPLESDVSFVSSAFPVMLYDERLTAPPLVNRCDDFRPSAYLLDETRLADSEGSILSFLA